MKEKKTYKSSWYEFTPSWSGFALNYDIAGYYTRHPVLQIYLIWGKLFLYLPWYHYKKIKREKTLKEQRFDKLKILRDPNYKPKEVYKKQYYDECDPPSYGIYIHMNQLGIKYGTKTKLIDFPWLLDWVRTSALRIDGEWEHDKKGSKDSKNFWDIEKWKNILFIEKHPYRYITKNGKIQDCIATIRVEEREWRWKWFKWLKYTRKIRRDIEIDFSDDIGEKKGTYKGGCTGCSYEMLKNETPYETLKRMEKERKF